MVTINKATLSSNVWETFYDRILANVTSVTLSDSTTRTVKTVTGSFPDKAVDSDKPTSDYPIIVINTPTISWDGPPSFSLTKKKAMISINIEIIMICYLSSAISTSCCKCCCICISS